MDIQNIAAKLQWKQHKPSLVLDAPANFYQLAAVMEAATEMESALKYEFVLFFCRHKLRLEEIAEKLFMQLKEDAVFWVAYPKKNSIYFTGELTRDNGWEIFAKNNFEPVRLIALNEDWSALRFRNVDFIKSMSRKSAESAKGKARIKNNKGK